jgi:hypothetical protein
MRRLDSFPRQAKRISLRVGFMPLVAASLTCGIAGGLVRAGITFTHLSAAAWLPQAVLGHAFLMVSSFLGTVIGLERAVALKHPAGFASPVASALSGVLLLGGQAQYASWLALAAATAFVAVNIVVTLRQRAAHTALLLVAAVAWMMGALLHAAAGPPQGVVSWWLAFLVLTIAAERLEMTRLMRRRKGAPEALVAVLAGLVLGSTASSIEATVGVGSIFYGVSLVALSAWLLVYDIARRTVTTTDLSRYMAVCLLLGYGWLAVAGVAWVGTSLGLPWRDAALHGIALGFVFSMIFGHAPVILPALVRLKLMYSWAFYVPLALLHLSLLSRLLLRAWLPDAGRLGAAANAVSIALFALVVLTSIIAWRVKYSPAKNHHGNALDT